MKYKIPLITIQTVAIGVLIFFFEQGGVDLLSNSYIFLSYLIFTTLSLPFLISKVILRKEPVSFFTVLSFLYYPIGYLSILGLSKLQITEFSNLIQAFTTLTLIAWNILFLSLVIKSKTAQVKKSLTKLIFLAIPVSIYLAVLLLFVRDRDSVVALDYLQHTAVTKNMTGEIGLCLLPGQCSNLFLQQGYTTFYHTILGFLTSFSASSPTRIFFVLDLIFPIIMSYIIYSLFLSATKSKTWSLIGVLLSLFVFATGAFDAIFFIPQTFTFLLFLILLVDRNLKFATLIAGCIILVLSHFVIGTFLALVLGFFFITLSKTTSKKERNIISILMFLTAISLIIASIPGFSFEKYFQKDELTIIGGATTPAFPENVSKFMGILGINSAFLVFVMILYLLKKKLNSWEFFAFFYVCLNVIIYFFGPTYANKFTIGMGIFSALLIVRYLQKLKYSPVFIYYTTLLLSLSFATNFKIQYDLYLDFYTQSNGQKTSIVAEDQPIIDFLNDYDRDCTILSDPYTQLIVTSRTNHETARAHYIKPTSRNRLYEYISEPSDETYEKMVAMDELADESDICILYTSRLEKARLERDISWTINMYSYIIDNNRTLERNTELREYLKNIDFTTEFENDNFILFTPSDRI